MLTFDYQIVVHEGDGPSLLTGSFALDGGEQSLVCTLPEGRIGSVTARAPLHLADGEKVFLNGFQTWTYCPEFTAHDTQRDHMPLPRAMVNKFALDRYGDYHFVEYPNKPGLFHGFSYCYFRLGSRWRLIASLDEHPGYF